MNQTNALGLHFSQTKRKKSEQKSAIGKMSGYLRRTKSEVLDSQQNRKKATSLFQCRTTISRQKNIIRKSRILAILVKIFSLIYIYI